MAIRSVIALAAVVLMAAGSADFATAMKNMPAQSDKFRSMMSNLSVTQFHFVSVAGEIDSATLKKNAANIADLRDTLSHATLTDNQGVVTSLTRVLTTKKLTIDQIVCIYVGGGQITLYYQ